MLYRPGMSDVVVPEALLEEVKRHLRAALSALKPAAEHPAHKDVIAALVLLLSATGGWRYGGDAPLETPGDPQSPP